MQKLFLVFYFLLFFFPQNIIRAQSDIKEAKIRLEKLSDFSYQYYIRIVFNKGGIINEDQARNAANFSLSIVSDETGKLIPIKKVEILKGAVALYTELNQDKKFLLSVRNGVLRYKVDSSYVSGGQCSDTLAFSEDQKPYLALTPLFKVDVSPISTSQLLNGTLHLDFNLDVKGPISFIDEKKIYGSLSASGVATSRFDSSINSITFAGQIKYSLSSNWYMPVQIEVKNDRTEDFKQSDYVVSVGFSSLIPIPNLHLTQSQFSPFPELNLNYEAVLQSTTNVLSTNRITAKLDWCVPIGDDFTLNIAVNGTADPSNMSSKNIKDYFDIGLDHKITDVLSAVIKYTKGSLPPLFNQIPESYLAGFDFKF